jgi:hypothetical protein
LIERSRIITDEEHRSSEKHTWKNGIHNLAIDPTSMGIFDFLHIALQSGIDPLKDFTLAYKVGFVHDA